MKLNELPMDIKAKLTGDRIKQLQIIIVEEFDNKESLFHQAMEQQTEKIMKKYRETVGFEKLRTDLTKAEDRVSIAQRDIKVINTRLEEVGLDENGNEGDEMVGDPYDSRKQHKSQGYIKLQKLLKVVKDNSPMNNLKAKLIARLNCATTIGEANVIMREVLGNGVIPNTDIKQITFES